MELLKRFFSEYKKDLAILLILAFLFCCTAVYVPRFASLYIDNPREAYVPQLILNGEMLYKDIFALFNPLSYQFNSLLYLIFGQSFRILYIWSYINAFAFLFGMYCICRMFTGRLYSAVLIFGLMYYYVFGNFMTVVTYIFPYAFATVYAVTIFTYSTLAFLYYMKTGKTKLLYLSVFLLGFVWANKPEFLLCFIPMLIVMSLKKEKIRSFILFPVLLITPVLFSYLILFMQGYTPQDLLNHIIFAQNFFDSPEQKSINAQMISPAFNIENILMMLKISGYFIVYMLVGVLYFRFLLKNKYFAFFMIPLFPFYAVFCMLFFEYTYNYDLAVNYLCWHVFALVIILCFKFFKSETIEDKMLLFLSVTGILSMLRINFFPLQKLSYGIYFLIPITCVWLYFVRTRKGIFSSALLKKSVIAVIITTSFFYLNMSKKVYDYFDVTEFKTPYGSFYTEGIQSEVFKKDIEFIEKNSKKTDSVLVLPEGTMLNYLTGRPSEMMYYQLTPNHITAFGEDNIINKLKKDKPEFIIFAKSLYDVYGTPFVCDDFAFKICNFVENNYELKANHKAISEHQGFEFSSKIYKLRSNDKEENRDESY